MPIGTTQHRNAKYGAVIAQSLRLGKAVVGVCLNVGDVNHDPFQQCPSTRGPSIRHEEYLDPDRYPNWKSQLRDGILREETVVAVAERLVAIHAATAGRPGVAAAFDNGVCFYAIRLEPYLVATGRVHPDLSARGSRRSASATLATKRALVHGDVSPKNTLVGPDGPVFINSECAWYGEPAFDLAFCLNHLLLKCLWRPERARGFLRLFDRLTERYLAGVTWQPRAEMEALAAALSAGAAAGPDRRQVADRICHGTAREEPGPRFCTPIYCNPSGSPRRHSRCMGPTGSCMSTTEIISVRGRRVWDSRGRPTVEAEVTLAGGAFGRAIAPAGASTGAGEAVDLRDGGSRFRWRRRDDGGR